MLKFGVEIECVYKNHELPSMPEGWQCVGDGSISPVGLEFVSPIFTWEDRGQVFKMVEELQSKGASCNQSCGLHVHMSGEFPEWKTIRKTGEKWYEGIKSGFRPAEPRRSRYVVETWNESYPYEKYRLVRLVEESFFRKHIEVRLFNAHLCKRWVARCLGATKQFGETLESQNLLAV